MRSAVEVKPKGAEVIGQTKDIAQLVSCFGSTFRIQSLGLGHRSAAHKHDNTDRRLKVTASMYPASG